MAGGVHPYILMSFNGQLSDVYTLIHELGHAGQMINAEKNNLFLTDEPSLYLVESQSTFNELLMANYLQKTQEDPRTQRFARAQMLTNTYFHNFITHLLEAAYQREVYRLVDAGKGFTADTLSQLKYDVLHKFWGDAVELNPGAELTWMRQPHYYMGLYSYTYSAGLTISTEAYLNVINGKPGAVDDWLNYLKLGSDEVIPAAKLAGVDVTTQKPLDDTIAFLDKTIDEIMAYSKVLNKEHAEVVDYVKEQLEAKEAIKVAREDHQSSEKQVTVIEWHAGMVNYRTDCRRITIDLRLVSLPQRAEDTLFDCVIYGHTPVSTPSAITRDDLCFELKLKQWLVGHCFFVYTKKSPEQERFGPLG